MKISEISDFSILSYTQDWKLENLGNLLFTSIFGSAWNPRSKNHKNDIGVKKTVTLWHWLIRTNEKFASFQFCLIPKMENLKI